MTLHKPQRLSQPAAPGALLKRAVNLHNIMRMRLIEPERDEAYLELIRQFPCLKCMMEPCGEASHTRISSAAFNKRGGMGKKPADRFAVPLDHGCHVRDPDALHRIGEYIFWANLGINPLLVAERLYGVRGDLVAMRAVVLQAISERGTK